VQDHPKDVEFLNCPIRFYTEMEAIYGHSMATGKFVVGSGEALGAPIKTEGVGETIEIHSTSKTLPDTKSIEILTNSTVGGKRKRGAFTEDEKLLLTNMSDVVNNVANALRETGPAHIDANLYLAVIENPGFTEEALIVAYTFLLNNKAQGRGFVGMSDNHRGLWLRTFLSKNYYG
jgi:hypothetical protein